MFCYHGVNFLGSILRMLVRFVVIDSLLTGTHDTCFSRKNEFLGKLSKYIHVYKYSFFSGDMIEELQDKT